MHPRRAAEQGRLHPGECAVAGVEVAEVPAVLAGQRIIGFVQQRQRQDAGRQQDHAGRPEAERELDISRCADARQIARLRYGGPRAAVVVDAGRAVLNLEHIGRHAHCVVTQVLYAVDQHPVELGRGCAKADLGADDAVVSLGLKLQVCCQRVDGQGVKVGGCRLRVDPEQPAVLDTNEGHVCRDVVRENRAVRVAQGRGQLRR